MSLAWIYLLALPALALAPKSPKETLDAAEQSFESRRYEEAVSSLESFEMHKLRHGHMRRAYELLGESYQHLGKIDKAIGVYQLASGLFPTDLVILTNLADLLHRSGLDDRAIPLYERVLAIHPNNAVSNLGMAEIELSMGFFDRSAFHYERCLQEWPDNPSVWKDYAVALAKRRDYEKASVAIEKSLKLDPGNAASTGELAKFQRQQNLGPTSYRTIENAIGLATAQERYAPIRLQLVLLRALWFLEDGRLDECESEVRGILAKYPTDPLGLWMRASLSTRRGRTRAAIADLEAVVSQRRQSPFTASVAEAMLVELRRAP